MLRPCTLHNHTLHLNLSKACADGGPPAAAATAAAAPRSRQVSHRRPLLLTRARGAQANAGHARHTKLTYSRAKPAGGLPRPGSAAAAALSAVEHAGGGMERRLLCREDLRRALQLREQPVELYWPEDDTWWPARITEARRPGSHIFGS